MRIQKAMQHIRVCAALAFGTRMVEFGRVLFVGDLNDAEKGSTNQSRTSQNAASRSDNSIQDKPWNRLYPERTDGESGLCEAHLWSCTSSNPHSDVCERAESAQSVNENIDRAKRSRKRNTPAFIAVYQASAKSQRTLRSVRHYTRMRRICEVHPEAPMGRILFLLLTRRSL